MCSVRVARRRTVLGTAPSFAARLSDVPAPRLRCASDPLLRRRSLTDDAPPAHTVDQFVSLGRCKIGGRASDAVAIAAAHAAYASRLMLILQPTFLDEQLSADFNVDEQVLAAVSMAFFGAGASAHFSSRCSADRTPKPPRLDASSRLQRSPPFALPLRPFPPSAARFSALQLARQVAQPTCFASRGLTCRQWHTHLFDDGRLSLCAAALPGLIYLTDEVHASWRIQH